MFIFPSGSTAYQIANSVRFRANVSAYLSRTPGAAGNSKLLAGRYRIKRGSLGSLQVIASAGTASIDRFYFDSSDRLCLDVLGTVRLVTTPVYRDPGSHYVDVGFQLDVANGTAALRAKILINGTEVAAYSTDTRSAVTNTNTNWNATVVHYLGRDNAGNYFDGYISEPIGVDGATLSNYSFQDPLTGAFAPLSPSATYGTNGFYLKFNDGSNLTNLCLDRSGNGNNWTATGISLTAGITYDWVTDTPTNNYCVLNPLSPTNGSTIAGANMEELTSVANNGGANGTLGMTTGKWYWEMTSGSGNGVAAVGIRNSSGATTTYPGSDGNSYSFYQGGQKWTNGANQGAYGASWTTTDVIGVLFDADAGTLAFYKQTGGTGAFTSYGNAFTGITAGTWFPAHGDISGSFATYDYFNFGQRPFNIASQGGVPTGAKTLCTQNLPVPTIKKGALHFDAVTQLGSSVSTGAALLAQFSNFTADLAWGKDRAAANNHQLVDTVRGSTAVLQSNTTAAETTYSAPTAGDNCVAWGWKGGGAAVTNNSGSISSQVSANTTAGFSIVTYTGTGANATVGHGLGVAPKLIIVKDRTAASTNNWGTWQTALSGAEFLLLNTTAAKATGATYWNSATPTSSVFSVGTSNDTNQNAHTYVAYCFAEGPGFSKFGSYTGNGSTDGTFVYLGLRPKFVLIKRINSTSDWFLYDAIRPGYNVIGGTLLADTAGTETTAAEIDFLSNGFKLRVSTTPNVNGGTYIFAAFAETPFNYANAR